VLRLVPCRKRPIHWPGRRSTPRGAFPPPHRDAFLSLVQYPLLSGVDEYDDTYFNARQSVRLGQELKLIAAG